MTLDAGYHFRIEDLQEAILWSHAQGPWGKTLQVIAAHKTFGEVLEVFGPGGIVPRWRVRTDGNQIRMTDYLGMISWCPTLKDALSAIAAVLDGGDCAQDQGLPD